MKNVEVLNKISRNFHKVGFQLKKHSPAILVGVGVVGVVTMCLFQINHSSNKED